MKVILLEDVPNLGKKYDVKDVKNGHAMNLLIPQKLAKPATKENMKRLEEQKKQVEVQATEDLKKTQNIVSSIEGTELNISVKVGDDGQLFESINSQKISEKLKEAGFEVKKSQINLDQPVKELGEFPIKINLDHNLEAEITLIVSPEEKEEK